MRFTCLAIKNLSFPFSSNYYLLFIINIINFETLSLQRVMRSALCVWCTTVSFAELWVYICTTTSIQFRSCVAVVVTIDPWFLFIFKIFLNRPSLYTSFFCVCVCVLYSVPNCLHKEFFIFVFPFLSCPLPFLHSFLSWLTIKKAVTYIYVFIVISYAIYSIMLCILSLLYSNMW